MKSYFKIWKPIKNNQVIQYHIINNYFDDIVHSEILEITLKLYNNNEFVKLIFDNFCSYRASKDFYATYNCDDLHKSSFWTMKNSDFLIDVVNSGRDKIPDTWIDAIRSYLIVTSENFIEIVSFDEPRIIIM